MKLFDYINKSIIDHPTLYLCAKLEDSRRSILDHVFLTTGNGIDWAYTKKQSDGGYCVTPRYVFKNNKYKRLFDKPYGEETCNYSFDEIIEIVRKTLVDKDVEKIINRCCLNNPYPFSVKFSIFRYIESGTVKIQHIKDDWKAGAVEVLHWALSFFQNKESYYSDSYYGYNHSAIEMYIKRFCPTKSWNDILKSYDICEHVDENDYKSLCDIRREQQRNNYIKEINKALRLVL